MRPSEAGHVGFPWISSDRGCAASEILEGPKEPYGYSALINASCFAASKGTVHSL